MYNKIIGSQMCSAQQTHKANSLLEVEKKEWED